jgi:hypothetical protein
MLKPPAALEQANLRSNDKTPQVWFKSFSAWFKPMDISVAAVVNACALPSIRGAPESTAVSFVNVEPKSMSNTGRIT